MHLNRIVSPCSSLLLIQDPTIWCQAAINKKNRMKYGTKVSVFVFEMA